MFLLRNKKKYLRIILNSPLICSSVLPFIFPWKQDRGSIFGWLDRSHNLLFLFSGVSVISGRWKDANERLCGMELSLWLKRFPLPMGIKGCIPAEQASP